MKYKWFFVLIIIMLVAVVLAYNYIYPGHRNIKTEQAQFHLSSKKLIDEFISNANKAEKKFLNKTIEINGNITEINSNTLILDNSVFCQFTKSISPNTKVNTFITIKGRCIGFDDLIGEIKLDQCNLIIK